MAWIGKATDILGSIIGAVDKAGGSTLAAKSGLPGLKTLGAFNEWHTRRRKLKNVPAEVVAELAAAYGIEAQGEAPRENVEEQLRQGGVDDPEQAYEVVLRRLTARVDCGALADYLGSEFERVAGLFRRVIDLSTSHLHYLQRIEQVLELWPDQDGPAGAEWFRRTGPLAVDFRKGCVYLRPDDDPAVKAVRKALQERRVVVLQGDAATGKTCLVRQLALEFHERNAYPEVHYVQCGRHGDVQARSLTGEAAGASGLLIVEDAHLAPRAVSRLHDALQRRDDLRLLLVTRPSLWDALDDRYDRLLTLKGHTIPLHPFSIADAIIGGYADSEEGRQVEWTEDVREAVKRASERSFWLLAYALEGCVESKGLGDSGDWVGKGVRADLRRLAEQLDAPHPLWPRILVALSALYLYEVMTAGPYLTENLGLSEDDLAALVRRGDVTRSGEGNGAYYGLPHSALADAYWRHGQDYRPPALPADETELVYRYASSPARNALEAAVRPPPAISKPVLERLESAGRIDSVVAKNLSAEAVRLWLDRQKPGADLDPALAEAIAQSLKGAANRVGTILVLRELAAADGPAASLLAASLDTRELAEDLMYQEGQGWQAREYVDLATEVAPELGHRLEEEVRQCASDEVVSSLGVEQFLGWLKYLCEFDRECAGKVFEGQQGVLSGWACSAGHVDEYLSIVYALDDIDWDMGEAFRATALPGLLGTLVDEGRFSEAIDLAEGLEWDTASAAGQFGAKVNLDDSLPAATEALRVLRDMSFEVALGFCARLEPARVAEQLVRFPCLWDVESFVLAVACVDVGKARAIVDCLPHGELRDRVERFL